MPGAARTTDSTTAHSPCSPGTCSQGSSDVYINNLPAFRVGDRNTPHGVPVSTPTGTPCGVFLSPTLKATHHTVFLFLHLQVLFVFHTLQFLHRVRLMYLLTVDH